MALKDVLEDKKKKRTITIVGTIVIILVTAGVFSYEASSIEVKEPPKEGVTTGNATTTTGTTVNETGSYHREYDGTIQGSSRYYTFFSAVEHEFPVEEGAKRAVITVSSDKDVDLFIHGPDGNTVDSSATAETTETVELDANELAEGGVGTWDAGIKHYSIATRPFNSADYHIVIDVYYE